jgi:hypothetical protein
MRYRSDDDRGDGHDILRVWVVGGWRQVRMYLVSVHSTFGSIGVFTYAIIE